MREQKSFTLIELMVVIAILGLLASIILVSLSGVKERARIAKILVFSQSVHHLLGADVVGMWSFETIEPGNKVLDASGYENHGTVVGATLTKGVIGNALSFNHGDYVKVPKGNLAITGDVTVSFWWFPTYCPETYMGILISMGNHPKEAYIFYVMGQGIPPYTCWLYWGFYDNSGSERNVVFYVPFSNISNRWNHILGVRKNGVLTLYLNGDRVAGPTDYSTYPVVTPVDDLGISAFSNGANTVKGLFDEIRIYEQSF
ncbi:prepilin-type N-terminal cleavage/methylation domain-containing protein [Patescibacteria group bacterium]|nr:prepilin-type N-terminal cleavage/methylation domain-containing protein [Patescibacteria group bacterium]